MKYSDLRKYKQLNDEIDSIHEILIITKESLKILEYILKAEDNKDLNYIKRNNSFIAFERVMLWNIIVIELAKLYIDNRSNHYNLKTFIKKFKKDREYFEINLDRKQIENWERMIEAESENIYNIKLQRDKVYAHSDRYRNELFNKVSLEKTSHLVEIGFSILQEIGKAFSFTFIEDLNNSPMDGLKSILNAAAKEKIKN